MGRKGEVNASWQRFDTSMRCGHKNIFTSPGPKPGDIGWCYRCWDYSTVDAVRQFVYVPRKEREGIGGSV